MEPTTAQAPAEHSLGIVAERESFAFVLNVRRLIDVGSYSLAPGHELRRATPYEIAFIKDTIKKLGPAPDYRFDFLWEHRVPHPGGPIVLLPEAEWRYFVIAFRGNNQTLVGLEQAFDLAPLELEIGFTAMGIGPGHGLSWTGGRLFHVLEIANYTNSFFVDVAVDDLDEMRVIHSQLQRCDASLIPVQNLVQQLGQLKALPHYSPLRFLGYFAILESVLTHTPKPLDPYDSITRQVKKKIALLNRRFPRKIDYAPFESVPADKVWACMYDYRSCVAHGDTPDFTRKLAVLKNSELALTLIRETVKAVIRHALTEPQLLLDLKEC